MKLVKEVTFEEPKPESVWPVVAIVLIFAAAIGFGVYSMGELDGRANLRQEQHEAQNWTYHEAFLDEWNKSYGPLQRYSGTTVFRDIAVEDGHGYAFDLMQPHEQYYLIRTAHGHVQIDGEDLDLRQLRHDYGVNRPHPSHRHGKRRR